MVCSVVIVGFARPRNVAVARATSLGDAVSDDTARVWSVGGDVSFVVEAVVVMVVVGEVTDEVLLLITLLAPESKVFRPAQNSSSRALYTGAYQEYEYCLRDAPADVIVPTASDESLTFVVCGLVLHGRIGCRVTATTLIIIMMYTTRRVASEVRLRLLFASEDVDDVNVLGNSFLVNTSELLFLCKYIERSLSLTVASIFVSSGSVSDNGRLIMQSFFLYEGNEAVSAGKFITKFSAPSSNKQLTKELARQYGKLMLCKILIFRAILKVYVSLKAMAHYEKITK
uniref:Uncharacterized protein n=1 Tax=Glossina austeni TaxID=7395 RepID=A0A1A9VY16_GLOAU